MRRHFIPIAFFTLLVNLGGLAVLRVLFHIPLEAQPRVVLAVVFMFTLISLLSVFVILRFDLWTRLRRRSLSLKPSMPKPHLLFLLMLLSIGAALYSYTGPNRTYTTYVTVWSGDIQGQQCEFSGGRWHYVVLQTYACDDPGQPWLTDFPDYYYACAPATNGNRVWASTCTSTSVPTTQSYPPATVTGSASCDQPGANGWCVSGAHLNLTANEPLSGYVITGLESSLGMLCTTNAASVTCRWNFPEGSTTLNYWALSSYGDTSTQASAAMKVDTSLPTLSVTQNGGMPGNNGWFTGGLITLTASASDATSGLAALQNQVDGSTWQSGNSVNVIIDGSHTITFQAVDLAGNLQTEARLIQVDSQLPQVSILPSIPVDASGWYTAPVSVSARASDATSGIALASVSEDGTSWSPALTLGDGIHTLQAQAVDLAGNRATATATFKVDSQPPTLALNTSGTPGSRGWFTTLTTLSAQASDAGSGITMVEMQVDGGSWQAINAVNLSDGVHTVTVRATDAAGNQVSETRALAVDTTPPQASFTSSSGSPQPVVTGTYTLSGTLNDSGSGLANAQVSLDNGRTWQPLSLDATGGWLYTWDTSNLDNGLYTLQVRGLDQAGNPSPLTTLTVLVANQPPLVEVESGWTLPASGQVSILARAVPIDHAQVTISDPQGRWPARVLTYTAANLPTALTWDGYFGSGIQAPSGAYNVEVSAWDIYGNRGSDTGVITIAPPPTATATFQPAATPGTGGSLSPAASPVNTATTTPMPRRSATVTPTATMTPSATASVLPSPTLPATPAPGASPVQPISIKPASNRLALLSLLAWAFWLAVLASASLIDPRPRALKEFGATVETIIQKNQSIES